MSDKPRCQSCGMPLDGVAEHHGTNSDGSMHPEFCKFCFQNGAFTQPNQTMTQMIESSIEFMSSRLNFSREQASEMSWAVIPTLKRWRSQS